MRAARRELDAVIDEIRAVPGFESFQAAPTFADVVAAASARPMVYVTPAVPGGLALIVRGSDVAHVPLAGLTAVSVRERAASYLDAYATRRTDRGRDSWRATLDAISAWAWDSIMGPILDALAEPTDIVVVAGGLLGLLPLHAASVEDSTWPTGRRHALDTNAISYAPNARALTAASAIAADTTMARTLVIVEPQPVSAPNLPFSRPEGELVAATSSESIVLTGGEATVAGFRRAAPGVGVMHFACHGLADLDAPLDSGLLLAGNHWITLRDLMALDLRVRLVVLSACETALPGTELPDEVVALPTGLLQAGAAGVVASQWAVPDHGTALLMADLYRRLRTESPAVALRNAQQWLRDSTNGQKVAWLDDAASGPEAWISATTAERLIDRLAYVDPEVRSHAELRAWAGFTHVGV